MMEEDAFDFYTELQEQYDEDSDSYDDESEGVEVEFYDPQFIF